MLKVSKISEYTHDGSMVLVEKCSHDWGILMGSMLPYLAYMDAMGYVLLLILDKYNVC
jgi:hypothetical protein